ncbi:heterokaryon incompatibility protein-domain-containing protein [Thelonectria olida]|uniref:Heterokaryon incompatibility protein-domain-containing protein n=1 Tax=Thelonectria olida TaxID=1576542 RepID=A0A9P9ANF2_9HYPO|nr:heterokaryon incompatibility protein-domain-containing protein [Thelonectria olida]
MDYTYEQSIGSSHLRLLRPTLVSQQRIAFDLIHVSRAAAPPYTAVSYTWGNDEPSETIQLDGRAFRVRPNLWSCLYYLSLASGHARWSYLWVDAICIDQGNDKERNDQVRRMDQTYRDATCVSVWLGLIPVPEEYEFAASHCSPLKTVESDGFVWEDWLHDLANRAYWSRYWVIQEFLLGKDVQLHCSNTQMDWMDFQELLCRNARIEQFGDEHLGVLPDGKAATFAAVPLTLGRHVDKHPEFLQPLANLLVTHHRSQCKDPRDRVFSLLGLVETDERALLNRFFPDYTLEENVVWIITLAHLMQYGSLENPELKDLTPNSEDIFRGLGIGSKIQRKKLLGQVDMIDYLGEWRPGELPQIIESHIRDLQLRVNEDEVGVEEIWTEEADCGGTCGTRLLKGVIIILVIVVSRIMFRDGNILSFL